MSRRDKLSTYKTSVFSEGGRMKVVYHSTVIVEWNDFEIVLNTGGWDTVTTRRKMNQASRQFGLGFSVSRVKGETIVSHGPTESGPFINNRFYMVR